MKKPIEELQGRGSHATLVVDNLDVDVEDDHEDGEDVVDVVRPRHQHSLCVDINSYDGNLE